MAYSRNDVSLKIEFIKGNTTITVEKGGSYRLVSMGGYTAPEADLTVEDRQSGGGYISGKRYEARALSFVLGIPSLPDTETRREALMSFFTPHSEMTVRITKNGNIRQIKGYADGAVSTARDSWVNERAQVSFNLICEQPFFEAVSYTFGTWSAQSCTLVNNGHTDCGFICGVTVSGSLVNPSVSCGDKIIEVLGTFADGDVLEVSTENGNCYITVNGSAYYRFAPDSEFFTLPVGSSVITLGCSSGNVTSPYAKIKALYGGI